MQRKPVLRHKRNALSSTKHLKVPTDTQLKRQFDTHQRTAHVHAQRLTSTFATVDQRDRGNVHLPPPGAIHALLPVAVSHACATDGAGAPADALYDDPPEQLELHQFRDNYTNFTPEPGHQRTVDEHLTIRKYNVAELRVFEHMYIDLKDLTYAAFKSKFYALVLVDYKSLKTEVVLLHSKEDTIPRLCEVLIYLGVHKLPYLCTVHYDSDGTNICIPEGLRHLGIAGMPTIPHRQSANLAELAIKNLTKRAKRQLLQAQMHPKYLGLALRYCSYVDQYISQPERAKLSSWQILYGTKPDIKHLKPFGSLVSASLSTAKLAVAKQQQSAQALTGELCLFVGYGDAGDHCTQSDKVYLLLTKAGTLCRSKDVHFMDKDPRDPNTLDPKMFSHEQLDSPVYTDIVFTSENLVSQLHLLSTDVRKLHSPNYTLTDSSLLKAVRQQSSEVTEEDTIEDVILKYNLTRRELEDRIDENIMPPADMPKSQSAKTKEGKKSKNRLSSQNAPGTTSTPDAAANAPITPDPTPPGPVPKGLAIDTNQGFHGDLPKRRPRLKNVNQLRQVDFENHLNTIQAESKTDTAEHCTAKHTQLCDRMASAEFDSMGGTLHPQKDMSWKTALSDPLLADKAEQAFNKEVDSLTKVREHQKDPILRILEPTHECYNLARQQAINCRVLLDVKRDGTVKARIVKQGFRESKEGEGNISAHVVSREALNILLATHNPSKYTLASLDVATAFLQSNPFTEGQVKYCKYTNPISNQLVYCMQFGPLYGERSAPIRWEETISTFVTELHQDPKFKLKEGNIGTFLRGHNDPCVFYNAQLELRIVLYVDDLLLSGPEKSIRDFYSLLGSRFELKELQVLTTSSPIDFLGMQIELMPTGIKVSMVKYTQKTVDFMRENLQNDYPYNRPYATPYDRQARCSDPDLPLTMAQRRIFMTGLGMCGWLASCFRVDIKYAYSMIASGMVEPLNHHLHRLVRLVSYLQGTSELCAASAIDPNPYILPDVNVTSEGNVFKVYCDSDQGGVKKSPDGPKPRFGYILLLNGFSVYSKSSSIGVAIADPDMTLALKEQESAAHCDTSSGAAETYAAGNCTHDLLILKHIFTDLHIEWPLPITLHIDNSAAETFMTGNATKRSKLRHIAQHQDWVLLLRNRGLFVGEHVDSKSNLADIFTKPLENIVLTRLRAMVLQPL